MIKEIIDILNLPVNSFDKTLWLLTILFGIFTYVDFTKTYLQSTGSDLLFRTLFLIFLISWLILEFKDIFIGGLTSNENTKEIQ